MTDLSKVADVMLVLVDDIAAITKPADGILDADEAKAYDSLESKLKAIKGKLKRLLEESEQVKDETDETDETDELEKIEEKEEKEIKQKKEKDKLQIADIMSVIGDSLFLERQFNKKKEEEELNAALNPVAEAISKANFNQFITLGEDNLLYVSAKEEIENGIKAASKLVLIAGEISAAVALTHNPIPGVLLFFARLDKIKAEIRAVYQSFMNVKSVLHVGATYTANTFNFNTFSELVSGIKNIIKGIWHTLTNCVKSLVNLVKGVKPDAPKLAAEAEKKLNDVVSEASELKEDITQGEGYKGPGLFDAVESESIFSALRKDKGKDKDKGVERRYFSPFEPRASK